MDEIVNRLKRAADYVKHLEYSPAYIALYGSQNYGLDMESDRYSSDYDFKCVVLPSFHEIVDEKDGASLTVEFEGGQIDIKDIRLFARSIEKMNPAYLEALLTENHLVLSAEKQMGAIRELLPTLFAERGALFAKVCAKLFDEKAKRLCHDSPAQAENLLKYGYDLKQAHHMYRLLVTLREFERTGLMQLLPPEHEKAQLMALKRGAYSLEEILQLTEVWRAQIQAIEVSIAQTYGPDKNNAVKEIEKLRKAAVYEHCRKEVLQDGEIPV